MWAGKYRVLIKSAGVALRVFGHLELSFGRRSCSASRKGELVVCLKASGLVLVVYNQVLGGTASRTAETMLRSTGYYAAYQSHFQLDLHISVVTSRGACSLQHNFSCVASRYHYC